MLAATPRRGSPSQFEETKERSSLRKFIEAKLFSPRSGYQSSSASLTPISQPFSARSSRSSKSSRSPRRDAEEEDNSFLTSFAIRRNNEKAHHFLSNHVGIVCGDDVIPPPPPRTRFSGLEENILKEEFGKPLGHMKPMRQNFAGTERQREVCFICDSSLGAKSDTERVLLLECGDRIHALCLEGTIECMINRGFRTKALNPKLSQASIRSYIIPHCHGLRCAELDRQSPIALNDQEFFSRALASAYLKVKLTAAEINAPAEPEIAKSHRLSICGSRVSQYFVKDNITLRHKLELSGDVSHTLPTRGITMRPLSCRTSAFSSMSHGDTEQPTAEQLKSYFLQHFLHIHPNLDLVFAMSLGQLRLADRLEVAIADGPFTVRTVFLFADYIAIVNEGMNPTLIPLDKYSLITTPNTSVVQVTSQDPMIPSLKLRSEDAALIEKWGIVISDKTLLIPVELFTSTILTSELRYTSFKPSLADLGLNNVTKKPEMSISPIMEGDLDSIKSVYLPLDKPLSSMAALEQEIKKLSFPASPYLSSELLGHSDLISPLRVHRKGSGLGEGYELDSDSEVDSDEEIIRQHRTPLY